MPGMIWIKKRSASTRNTWLRRSRADGDIHTPQHEEESYVSLTPHFCFSSAHHKRLPVTLVSAFVIRGGEGRNQGWRAKHCRRVRRSQTHCGHVLQQSCPPHRVHHRLRKTREPQPSRYLAQELKHAGALDILNCLLRRKVFLGPQKSPGLNKRLASIGKT
jgi:hypothetical protein